MAIRELRSIAEILAGVAEALDDLYQRIPKPPASPTSHSPAQAPPQSEIPKVLKLEEVRAVLAEKSRDGHTEAVRALLEKHGASKLSDIDPGKYASLLADAEAIGNE